MYENGEAIRPRFTDNQPLFSTLKTQMKPDGMEKNHSGLRYHMEATWIAYFVAILQGAVLK